MLKTHSRILLVEGESRIRRVLSSMLQNAGVKTVHAATNGAGGEDILRSFAVDVVVCDWNATEVSGVELLERVRSLSVTKYLPFLLMSRKGQLEADDFAFARDFDVDGHVFKPISEEDLHEQVYRSVERYNDLCGAYIHLSRAAALMDVGDTGEANDELRAAREEKPDVPRVLNECGALYVAMGQFADARACLKKAIEADRSYTNAYGQLGQVFASEGNPDEALHYFALSAKLSPRNKERQMSLARALLAKGETEEARFAIHRAMGDEVSASDREAAAAEFFLSEGRADLAESQYAFALEADPGNLHYYNRLGIAFRRQKKYKEATVNYHRAIKLSPKDPVLYYNLALALAESGDFEQARGVLRRALVIDPGFEEAGRILKRIDQRLAKAGA